MPMSLSLKLAATALTAALILPVSAAYAADAKGYLESIHRHVTLTSTVKDNGDLNPYALVVAPVSAGTIHQGDVLVDNFNDISNLQGTGTTIVDYNPTTKETTLFAKLPRNLTGCPGGVGLTTAMTMLKSGWIIVGSTPSTDGTTKTKGNGCLIVLDSKGQFTSTITGPHINGPWGNIVSVDNGTAASIFVSNAGDVPSPDQLNAQGYPVVTTSATVVRLDLSVAEGKAPVVKSQTVIADNLSAQANRDAFLVGPTGLAFSRDAETLYITDSVNNSIRAIADAVSRSDSAGTGREITKDGLMKRPLAMAMAPNGHLLVCNALNGQVVEIDPVAGTQIYAQWIDNDAAQSPPGNGDLFGIAMAPDGSGFYYVEDDMNTLVKAE